MRWDLRNQSDPEACALADRHYSRQTPGSRHMMPPGRQLVLVSGCGRAVWGSAWPYARYVNRIYPGAMICTIFRNEGAGLSSELIREAVAATRWRWPEIPPEGMITIVNPAEIRPKRDPGYCFIRAGFRPAGATQKGLPVLQLAPDCFPEAARPNFAPMV